MRLRSPDSTIELELLPRIGARLHRLRALGADVLRTPEDPSAHARHPIFWGAYVMAPWCNRIEAIPTRIGAQLVSVPSNFPDGSAIHGQVYARPWSRIGEGQFAVHGGGDGWPWRYDVTLEVGFGERSVRLDLAIRNMSDESMPAGLGLHPWFRTPLRAAIRAHRVYASNLASGGLPAPATGRFDLRLMEDIQPGLDATWTDLDDPPIELAWPALSVRATMRISAPSAHVVVASPNDIDAIAVESQTHAPQGMRRLVRNEPGALALLDPDGTLRLGVELLFAPLLEVR